MGIRLRPVEMGHECFSKLSDMSLFQTRQSSNLAKEVQINKDVLHFFTFLQFFIYMFVSVLDFIYLRMHQL